jgi:hypothetical protein
MAPIADLDAALAHLKTIQDYAREAAKTPITRESIRAAPQVDATMPSDLQYQYTCAIEHRTPVNEWSDRFIAQLIERIAQAEAALEARKLTELAQCDELQGFCRLVLSESGEK